MKENTTKQAVRKPKIHVGKMGGVWVDADDFLAQPKVQEQIRKMAAMDIEGMRLSGKKAHTETPDKDSK